MEFCGRHKRGSTNHRPQKYVIPRAVRSCRILGSETCSIHETNDIDETVPDMQRSTTGDIGATRSARKTEIQLPAALHRPHLAHSAIRIAMQLEEATAAASTATSTTPHRKVQIPFKFGDNNRHVPQRDIGIPNMGKKSPDPRLK